LHTTKEEASRSSQKIKTYYDDTCEDYEETLAKEIGMEIKFDGGDEKPKCVTFSEMQYNVFYKSTHYFADEPASDEDASDEDVLYVKTSTETLLEFRSLRIMPARVSPGGWYVLETRPVTITIKS